MLAASSAGAGAPDGGSACGTTISSKAPASTGLIGYSRFVLVGSEHGLPSKFPRTNYKGKTKKKTSLNSNHSSKFLKPFSISNRTNLRETGIRDRRLT